MEVDKREQNVNGVEQRLEIRLPYLFAGSSKLIGGHRLIRVFVRWSNNTKLLGFTEYRSTDGDEQQHPDNCQPRPIAMAYRCTKDQVPSKGSGSQFSTFPRRSLFSNRDLSRVSFMSHPTEDEDQLLIRLWPEPVRGLPV